MKKFIYISGIVLINFISIGSIFKVMHWPGAGVLITFGLVFFALCFLPLATFSAYKGNGNKNKSLYVAGYICAFIVIIGSLFKIQHWPGAGIMMLIGIPLPFLYFLPLYIYQYNKEKTKPVLNFLGVMFLMLFIVVLTSVLTIRVSKNILDAIKNSAGDMEETSELLAFKTASTYESIEKSGNTDKIKKLVAVREKTDAIFAKIVMLKKDLVRATMGEIIDVSKNLAESVNPEDRTSGFLINETENPTKAQELKNLIVDYRNFVIQFLGNANKRIGNVNSLLSTSDNSCNDNGKPYIQSWEESFFQQGRYVTSQLGNLDCIAIDVKMAEAEVLGYLSEKPETSAIAGVH